MNLHNYQGAIDAFARYPHVHAARYCAMGLFGETGEIANQVKKIWRDDEAVLTEDRKAKLRDELGDVLWYTVRFAHHHDVKVGELDYEIGGILEDMGLPAATDIFVATENLAILAVSAIVANLDSYDKRDEFYGEFVSSVLGAIATVASMIDTDLEGLAQANVDKLTGRVERGTLAGSGDNR